MGEFYVRLTEAFLDAVKDQAPQSVFGMAEKIVSSLIYHHTVGLIGGAAADSGAMPMPDFDSPAALCFTKVN